MAVQFYAYGSLFTPLYPDYMTEGGEGRVDHKRLQTRRHMHLSADCSPHSRRIAGGGVDSRISELSAFPAAALSRARALSFVYLFLPIILYNHRIRLDKHPA